MSGTHVITRLTVGLVREVRVNGDPDRSVHIAHWQDLLDLVASEAGGRKWLAAGARRLDLIHAIMRRDGKGFSPAMHFESPAVREAFEVYYRRAIIKPGEDVLFIWGACCPVHAGL